MKIKVDYVTIYARDCGEEFFETFRATDKVGISNFGMFVDETVKVERFTREEEVNFFQWMKSKMSK